MPKAKYEGIYHSIKKTHRGAGLPLSIAAAQREYLNRGIRLLPQHSSTRIGGAGSRRLCADHAGARRAGHLPAGGQKRRLPSAASRRFKKPPAATICKPLPVSFGLRRSLQPSSLLRKADFPEGDELWAVQRVRYLDGKCTDSGHQLFFRKNLCPD